MDVCGDLRTTEWRTFQNSYQEFKKTYNLFRETLNLFPHETYGQWYDLDDRYKAITLYVNFYEAILIAWKKAYEPHVEVETAISTLMQYLIKNVEVIKDHPKRFTPQYVYKVAFNAFYPLKRVRRDITWFYYRASAYTVDKDSLIECQISNEDDPDNRQYLDTYIESAFITEDKYFLPDLEELWDNLTEAERRYVEYLIYDRKFPAKYKLHQTEILKKLQSMLKIF